MAETRIGQQMAQAWQQPHQQTKAPPAIGSPRGSANVPRDLHAVATKADASDYIRARQQQIKKEQRS